MPNDTPPSDEPGPPTDAASPDDSEPPSDAESPPSDAESPPDERASDGAVFDRRTLSDLLVNAVPIGIILAFVVMFGLASPGGSGGDPLVLFHVALIVGVVLVSYVSARVIASTGAPLTGSAATHDDTGDPVEDD